MNPEGVSETERLFEVLQIDVVKYEEKSFDVSYCVRGFQYNNWTGSRGMGRGCWSW